MDIEDGIRDFIVYRLRWRGARRELTRDRPLISDGILDSLGIMELVSFVEDTFGVEVLDEDFVPEHFATIGALESFIAGKQTSGLRT